MAKTKIVIAEDDAVLRELYHKKFDGADFEVKTAADGEEAIRMIEEVKPDIVLADIHMPKVDGFGILQRFPATTRFFPIILLTNYDQPAFKLRAEELGADEYFVKKDMTIRSLLEMVRKVMEKKKPH